MYSASSSHEVESGCGSHIHPKYDCRIPSRMQVLELLSHVNKRVKGHDDIKLPLLPLLEVYNQAAAPPLVQNFSLVYLEMACERATAEEKFEAVRASLDDDDDEQHRHLSQHVTSYRTFKQTRVLFVQALLMLKGVNSRSQQHKEMLLRMAMTGLQYLSKMPPGSKLRREDDFVAK